jgi:hypothetical protein
MHVNLVITVRICACVGSLFTSNETHCCYKNVFKKMQSSEDKSKALVSASKSEITKAFTQTSITRSESAPVFSYDYVLGHDL